VRPPRAAPGPPSSSDGSCPPPLHTPRAPASSEPRAPLSRLFERSCRCVGGLGSSQHGRMEAGRGWLAQGRLDRRSIHPKLQASRTVWCSGSPALGRPNLLPWELLCHLPARGHSRGLRSMLLGKRSSRGRSEKQLRGEPSVWVGRLCATYGFCSRVGLLAWPASPACRGPTHVDRGSRGQVG